MNPIIIGYAAPPSLPYAKSFIENIRNYKTRNRLLLFSEYDWPNVLKINKDPVKFADEARLGTNKIWTVHNAIFFTSLRIAAVHDATHLIMLEGDCRVGCDYWDEVMLKEYEEAGCPPLAGSMVFHNPMNHDDKLRSLWSEAIKGNERENFPIATYGTKHGHKVPPHIFINGALGIYDMDLMRDLFGDFMSKGTTRKLSIESTAWDYEIGKRLWRKHEHGVVDMIHHMKCVFSGFGDNFVSEKQRKDMLENGDVVAVHQIKSDWQPKAKVSEMLPPVLSGYQEVVSDVENPTVDILIVSMKQHADWLRFCLKSISRFVTGVGKIHLVVPKTEEQFFLGDTDFITTTIHTIAEPTGKGHLCQMLAKCCADIYSEADYIWHIDSDHFFFEEMDASELFVDAKPICVFRDVGDPFFKDNPTHLLWREPTEKALNFKMPIHTMVWHQSLVYPRWLYSALRAHMEEIHEEGFADYIYDQHPVFPYGFCEFTTLGMLARYVYKDSFHWHNKTKGLPFDHFWQFWSHARPDSPINKQGFKGEMVVPSEVMTKILNTPPEVKAAAVEEPKLDIPILSEQPILSPKVWVFCICHNEAHIMPWFLAHYSQFASKILVWDDKSNDGTREMLEAHPLVQVADWPGKRQLDDVEFTQFAKNTYPMAKGKADWVMWVDADEFIWDGYLLDALKKCDEDGYNVARTKGYNMMGDGIPEYTPGNQLVIEYPNGVNAPVYAKTVVFKPDIEKMDWSLGKHHMNDMTGIKITPFPVLRLLHYRYLGFDYTRERNLKNLSRLPENRKGCGWTCEPNYKGEHSPEWAHDAKQYAFNVLKDGY